jgi:two-component system, NarL family, invasion response regulator UvrY
MTPEAVPVLVVDDLPSFRAAAAAVVAATAGFALAGLATSGEEALSKLAHTAVELVLMDVHMPGGGGHAVATEMLARYPRLTVVLLSVDTSPHARAAAEEQNVQFVPKSEFGPDVLESVWASRTGAA